MLNADCHFHIGRAHLVNGRPCQDFAMVKNFHGAICAMVADGCSSGGDTDIGARLIALSTAKTLEDSLSKLSDGGAFGMLAAFLAAERFRIMEKAATLLSLRHEDLLATCSYALATNRGALIHLAGDGVIAKKTVNGKIIASCYSWSRNAPLYPIYAADGYQAFIAAQSGEGAEEAFHEERWEISPDGGQALVSKAVFSLAESLGGVSAIIDGAELSDLEFIVVFTDGVCQIDGFDWREAIVNLMSFKNTTGEFAKRRMIRFVKEAEKIGRGPLDDLAYAVIHIRNEKEEEDGDSGKH